MICNVSQHTVCISFTPSHPFSISFGVTQNGCSHSFLFLLFIFIPHFFFFDLRLCLWFDLHRHLFLLVLFLLRGCDYNQEMEMQKSTCCHSKYVLFHPPDLLSALHAHLRVSPVFVCFCMAVLMELFCGVN